MNVSEELATKSCTTCFAPQPLSEFRLDHRRGKHRSECRRCHSRKESSRQGKIRMKAAGRAIQTFSVAASKPENFAQLENMACELMRRLGGPDRFFETWSEVYDGAWREGYRSRTVWMLFAIANLQLRAKQMRCEYVRELIAEVSDAGLVADAVQLMPEIAGEKLRALGWNVEPPSVPSD